MKVSKTSEKTKIGFAKLYYSIPSYVLIFAALAIVAVFGTPKVSSINSAQSDWSDYSLIAVGSLLFLINVVYVSVAFLSAKSSKKAVLKRALFNVGIFLGCFSLVILFSIAASK